MFNGIFDDLEAVLGVNEGVQIEESAVLELTELETFEIKFYISEIDEIRVNETAEIMAVVFF